MTYFTRPTTKWTWLVQDSTRLGLLTCQWTYPLSETRSFDNQSRAGPSPWSFRSPKTRFDHTSILLVGVSLNALGYQISTRKGGLWTGSHTGSEAWWRALAGDAGDDWWTQLRGRPWHAQLAGIESESNQTFVKIRTKFLQIFRMSITVGGIVINRDAHAQLVRRVRLLSHTYFLILFILCL